MHQVMFTIPFLKSEFPPDGFQIPAYGAMLFVAFILVVVWGTLRARKIGMPATRFQDFVIQVFIAGIIGARLLYMIQYANRFPDPSPLGMILAFFRIWEGGLVVYGAAFGGVIGYALFYWFVMRRLNVSGWQLADVVAPLLAMGLAIGRIGCYLNGCCWGQVSLEESCPVPLGSAHFPLLPAHAREQLVTEQYLQSSTGFTIKPRDRGFMFDDPRAVVAAVEPGSPAAQAGVQPGDRIVAVNGLPNAIVIELYGDEEKVNAAVDAIKKAIPEDEAQIVRDKKGRVRAQFNDNESFLRGRQAIRNAAPDVGQSVTDRLDDLAREWPRGKSQIELSVERAGQPQAIGLPAFTPLTVGLYPTQLYETVSMSLLMLFLLAYYPFRSHDGELMVILMLAYAFHRFIDESLRIEPSYTWGLTLSQWISVGMIVAAVGIEIYLWRATPSRWQRSIPAATVEQPAHAG